MKNGIRVLYDNTDLTEIYDDVKARLFDEKGEERGWESAEDIPTLELDTEVYFYDSVIWEDFFEDLQHLFDRECFLITGTCGRWNGPQQGGKFIRSASELMSCLRHLDALKFYDEGGHLKIDGYHHDGKDHYELRRLTPKGYELASRNYFVNDRRLHEAIFNCNIYSTLPRMAERLYGG